MNQAVDKNYRLLAARYLRKHTKRLAAELEPVCRAENIEAVHQARVASRRLRAALKLFADCFPAESVRRWTKGVRQITRGLGAARDQDVQILFLTEHLAELGDKACARGVAAMLGELERRRLRQQRKVLRVVKRVRRRETLEDILKTTRTIRARAKAKGIGIRSPLVVERAEQCIAERLVELYSHAGGLADPLAKEEHHAMRIASKSLRYALEMVSPVFFGELDECAARAKQLQTLLGEIHDYDVWDQTIDAFATKMRRRTEKYFGTETPFAALDVGLEHLREFCRGRRSEVFAELCRFWEGQPFRKIERSCVAAPPATDSPARCENGRPVCRDSR